MKKSLTSIVAAACFLLSFSAMAMHCPDDMKRIDEELAANPPVPDGDLAMVKKLRAEGEELHKAGKHEESIKVLRRAMDIMRIVPPGPGPT